MNNEPCPDCSWQTGHDTVCPSGGEFRFLKKGEVWRERGSIRALAIVLFVDAKRNVAYRTEEKAMNKTGRHTFVAIYEPYVPNGLDVVLDLLDSWGVA